ncbi:MAG: radical SAM protein [Campylobacterales bacterium]|nr:radical SAM protein [Campylobacterales bacterium]
MNSKTTFGPVASRRFGLSLGIDLSPFEKSCNFDCLYCELGREKTVDKIAEPILTSEIIEDIDESLENHPEVEILTVTANGEPTLYPYLWDLIISLNSRYEQRKLILTNGSTINKEEIQKILREFDVVKVSLDAFSKKTFNKIDRPLDIDIEDIKKGISYFSKTFRGDFIIEVLIIKNVNDSDEEIKEIGDFLNTVVYDRIDLGTIERPPAYNVQPVSNERLFELASYFDSNKVNVVSRKKDSKKSTYIEDEILKTVEKRPLSEEEIETLFDEKSMDILQQILLKGDLKKVEKNNQIFYTKTLDI